TRHGRPTTGERSRPAEGATRRVPRVLPGWGTAGTATPSRPVARPNPDRVGDRRLRRPGGPSRSRPVTWFNGTERGGRWRHDPGPRDGARPGGGAVGRRGPRPVLRRRDRRTAAAPARAGRRQLPGPPAVRLPRPGPPGAVRRAGRPRALPHRPGVDPLDVRLAGARARQPPGGRHPPRRPRPLGRPARPRGAGR